VNLGNPIEVSLRAMAEQVIEITGSSSTIVMKDLPPDDPKVRCPDISLAQKVLDGWEPKTSVAEGLRRTRDYFVEELSREAASAK
jgi:nucleoside-diphosphate-sugar epimerase